MPATDESIALLPLAQQQQVTVSSSTSLTVPVQHNGSTIASEPIVDFEDGDVIWAVADDSVNTRVKVTPTIGSSKVTSAMIVDGTIATADIANGAVDGTKLNVAAGTSFPGSPTDGQEYVYAADTSAGVFWRFRYYGSGSYWGFVGGSPLYSQVDAAESTNSGTYTALTTAGPSILLPFAGDWMVLIGCTLTPTDNASQYMSYDIGGTGAVDGDGIRANSSVASISRLRRKTGLTAVTLTAKYKGDTGNPATWENRFMAVWPVKK